MGKRGYKQQQQQQKPRERSCIICTIRSFPKPPESRPGDDWIATAPHDRTVKQGLGELSVDALKTLDNVYYPDQRPSHTGTQVARSMGEVRVSAR